MSPITPELQQKIALWRQRAAAGELTLDECKEGVALLREGRLAAAQAASSTKRAKAKVEIPSAADLLRDMENL